MSVALNTRNEARYNKTTWLEVEDLGCDLFLFQFIHSFCIITCVYSANILGRRRGDLLLDVVVSGVHKGHKCHLDPFYVFGYLVVCAQDINSCCTIHLY